MNFFPKALYRIKRIVSLVKYFEGLPRKPTYYGWVDEDQRSETDREIDEIYRLLRRSTLRSIAQYRRGFCPNMTSERDEILDDLTRYHDEYLSMPACKEGDE